MMAEIRHNVAIKATPEIIYKALTTQEGLAGWWTNNTIAKPELEFINIFVFGKFRNEMKVTKLIQNKKLEWECINSIEEWIGTQISFELEERNNHTLLRFTQRGWKEMTDTFAGCNYDWAVSIESLKALCEKGSGAPYQNK
jgi:uncharacterized protein YndB with AHSA1/START domain